jgi:CTP synthase
MLSMSQMTTSMSCYLAFDGIVIPGGFGTRGLEGKISAASFAAREKDAISWPMCLGMQMAVVALAREGS